MTQAEHGCSNSINISENTLPVLADIRHNPNPCDTVTFIWIILFLSYVQHTESDIFFIYQSVCLSIYRSITISKFQTLLCILFSCSNSEMTCLMAETVETAWRAVSSLSATGIGSVFIKILSFPNFLQKFSCFHFPFLSPRKDKLETTDTELLLLYWLTTRKRNHSLWVPPTKLWADPNNQLNILETNLRKTKH